MSVKAKNNALKIGLMVLGILIVLSLLCLRCSSESTPTSPIRDQEASSLANSSSLKNTQDGNETDQDGILGKLPACLFIFSFIIANWWCLRRAERSIKNICNDACVPSWKKLKKMKNEDVWFDLPLYLGLAGTVLGFVLISCGVAWSRNVAYLSTLMGILVSAWIRLKILRPARSKIIDSLESEDE